MWGPPLCMRGKRSQRRRHAVARIMGLEHLSAGPRKGAAGEEPIRSLHAKGDPTPVDFVINSNSRKTHDNGLGKPRDARGCGPQIVEKDLLRYPLFYV